MGLCFCDRASKEKMTSENDRPPVPALPAVIPPARLSNPRSELPETVALSNGIAGASRSNPSLSTSAAPRPTLLATGGLGAEEYIEATTNSNGEKPGATSQTSMPTSSSKVNNSKTMVGELSIDESGADQSGTSNNSLGNLVERIGSLHRTPSSESNRCRAIETESEKEDYAVAARRAEVRRLTHRMIQEELRQEHHSQLPRSYKSTTMTTINEDPSDGPVVVETSDSAGIVLSSDGPPGDHVEIPVVSMNSHSKSSSPARPRATTYSTLRPFSLRPSSIEESVMHKGLFGFRRFRDTHTKQPRSWKWASLVPTSTERKSAGNEKASTSDMPKLPAAAPREKENVSLLGSQEKDSTMDSHSPNQPTIAHSDTEDETATGMRHLCAPFSEDTRANQLCAVSESLSSIDEDGSIHEAREAHVVLKKKGLRSDFDEGPVGNADLGDAIKANPRVLNLSLAASGDGTTDVRRPSGVSGKSHMSSLELPPPLVEENAFARSQVTQKQDPVKVLMTNRSHFLDEQITANTCQLSEEKDTVQVVANRKVLAPFQILSRKGRDVLRTKKPGTVQATAVSSNLSAPSQTSDALVMQALNPRRMALLSEIGITLKKISRTPLDSRFRSADDHRPEAQTMDSQIAEGEPVTNQASVVNKLPDMVNTPGKQTHTSSALTLEKMAEEWHRQIRQLHIESLESQQHHAQDLTKCIQGANKKYLSHTWPPASKSSTPSLFWDFFKDAPQAAQQLDTLRLGNQPREQHQFQQSQLANALNSSGRSLNDNLGTTQLPESWWSLSVNTSGKDGHASSAKITSEKQESSTTSGDETDHPPENDRDNPQIPELGSVTGDTVSTATKFEKAMKFGMQKLLFRKQITNARSTSCDDQQASIVSHTERQPQKHEALAETMAKDGHRPAASQEAATKSQAQNTVCGWQEGQILDAHPSISPPKPNADDLVDTGNTTRVLTDRAGNQDKLATLTKSHRQDQGNGGDMATENKNAISQLTAPSTPVIEAYAEVRDYISKSFSENHANRVARRVSSFSTDASFSDAVAHQSGGEEHSGQAKEDGAKRLDEKPTGTTAAPWWMLRALTTSASRA